jgi:predicted  nucleic acid-binding Zn-ribbon protein
MTDELSAIEAELQALRARRARLADEQREVELEAEVKRLRAAYESALRNAITAKAHGHHSTPPAYAQHERVWQEALAAEDARVRPYSPFGSRWEV